MFPDYTLMSKRAVLGKMSLCYVKTSNGNIGSVVGNSKAKIVCINDAKVADVEEDEDSGENCSKKQNIYNQLQEVLKTAYCGKSKFEKL